MVEMGRRHGAVERVTGEDPVHPADASGAELVARRLSRAGRVLVSVRGEHGLRLRGTGEVTVRVDVDGSMLVSAAGTWRSAGRQAVRFTNAFRWRFDGDTIHLSHERRGPAAAVELVELVRIADSRWATRAAHICGEDRYSANLRLLPDRVALHWCVAGPRKTQLLRSTYATEAFPA